MNIYNQYYFYKSIIIFLKYKLIKNLDYMRRLWNLNGPQAVQKNGRKKDTDSALLEFLESKAGAEEEYRHFINIISE